MLRNHFFASKSKIIAFSQVVSFASAANELHTDTPHHEKVNHSTRRSPPFRQAPELEADALPATYARRLIYHTAPEQELLPHEVLTSGEVEW